MLTKFELLTTYAYICLVMEKHCSPDSAEALCLTSQATGAPSTEILRILQTKDYYSILQIKKDASEDEIKKAYKKLALKLHPDKNSARGAEDAFKKVSEAVQCLTDRAKEAAQKRHIYDQYGDDSDQPSGGGIRSKSTQGNPFPFAYAHTVSGPKKGGRGKEGGTFAPSASWRNQNRTAKHHDENGVASRNLRDLGRGQTNPSGPKRYRKGKRSARGIQPNTDEPQRKRIPQGDIMTFLLK